MKNLTNSEIFSLSAKCETSYTIEGVSIKHLDPLLFAHSIIAAYQDKQESQTQTQPSNDSKSKVDLTAIMLNNWHNYHDKAMPWQDAIKLISLVNELPDTLRDQLLEFGKVKP